MFLGGGAWFSVKIFGENFWNLFFRSRCRTSWSNVTILGLHLVLRSTMRKMEGFCEIHVFRREGPDFRSKFQELLFCRSRCCISWSNFIIFSFWLAIWWIMSNIKGFCEIYIFRGGKDPIFGQNFRNYFFAWEVAFLDQSSTFSAFHKCSWVDNEGDRSILQNSCFRGGGANFRPKFSKLFYYAVEVAILNQIS